MASSSQCIELYTANFEKNQNSDVDEITAMVCYTPHLFALYIFYPYLNLSLRSRPQAADRFILCGSLPSQDAEPEKMQL